MDKQIFRKCSICGKNLILDLYYKNKKGGIAYSWCKECHIEKGQKFRETPIGKLTEMKKDAKKRGIEFSITLEDAKSMWKDPCAYCGRKVKILSLDRIDNSKPYDKENVVMCCKWCNFTKGTSSQSFFYDQCKKVTENMINKENPLGNPKDCGERYEKSLFGTV